MATKSALPRAARQVNTAGCFNCVPPVIPAAHPSVPRSLSPAPIRERKSIPPLTRLSREACPRSRSGKRESIPPLTRLSAKLVPGPDRGAGIHPAAPPSCPAKAGIHTFRLLVGCRLCRRRHAKPYKQTEPNSVLDILGSLVVGLFAVVAVITDMARWTKSIAALVTWAPAMLFIVMLACHGKAPGVYENCPAFDPDEKEDVPRMLPAMPGRGDDVTLHPDLVEDTIEAIKRELKDPYTIERLEIEEAGEAIAVTVTDTGPGDRWTGPRHKLGDGRELYSNIHLWGWATFEDGSEISFHVWAGPAPSRLGCEIQGVAIQPSWFVPI